MDDRAPPFIDRDPEWRLVWESLNKQAQRQVNRALRRGEAMEDVGLAAVAAGAAVRRKRQLRWQGILFFIMGVGLGVYLVASKPAEPRTFYYIYLFVFTPAWAIILPVLALFQHRRAHAAELANKRVLEASNK